eukprot:COSAG04_NODE_82_length_27794_cov_76.265733_12_plen_308_part_00
MAGRLRHLAATVGAAPPANAHTAREGSESAPPAVVSPEVVKAFETDGVVLVRGLLPLPTVRRLREAYERARAEGARLSESPRLLQLSNPSRTLEWDSIPYLEPIVAVGRALAGDDISFSYDQLFDKEPGTQGELLYHQDAGYGWPGLANSRGMTAWLALSEATAAMGAPTYVLGSHRRGVVAHTPVADRAPESCGWRLERGEGGRWQVNPEPIGGALQAQPEPGDETRTLEYAAGDVSFHSGRTLHYTGANTTTRHRLGLSSHLWPSPNDDGDESAEAEEAGGAALPAPPQGSALAARLQRKPDPGN